jgi:hypothetical protein
MGVTRVFYIYYVFILNTQKQQNTFETTLSFFLSEKKGKKIKKNRKFFLSFV